MMKQQQLSTRGPGLRRLLLAVAVVVLCCAHSCLAGKKTNEMADQVGEGAMAGAAVGGAIGAVGGPVTAAAGAAIGAGVGALSKPLQNAEKAFHKSMKRWFCFPAGTPIRMADGSMKDIEHVAIGDDVLRGGAVTGTMQFPGHDTELFIYDGGVVVAGEHAVREEGVWKRVRDADKATPLGDHNETVLYDLITESHLLSVHGSEAVFSDYLEFDLGVLEEDLLLHALNKRCSMLDDVASVLGVADKADWECAE